MPFELVYLVAVFAVAIIGFALLKRPMYESMLAAFIVLVILTAALGAWEFSLAGLWGVHLESDEGLKLVCNHRVYRLSASAIANDGYR